MENFTNSNTKLFDAIREELLRFSATTYAFVYLEISHLLTYAFSVCHEKESGRFLVRKWDANFDTKRFSLGIFNISRLAISQEEHTLAEEKVQSLDAVSYSELTTLPISGVTLDGLHCELNSPFISQKLNWNLDEEMGPKLRELIFFLRSNIE